MHLGFVCPFNPAIVLPLLHPEQREAAARAGGRRNAPVGNLLPALLNRGHRISVFSFEPALRIPLAFEGPNLAVHLLPQRPQPFRPALDRFRPERAALAARIREVGPDLLHAHWTQTGHALAALDTRLPCWITVHDTGLAYEWHNRGLNPVRLLASLQRVLMTAEAARRARALVAVSPDVAEHLRRVFRFRGPIAVIPNPLPLDLYRPLRESRTRLPDPRAPVFADVSAWGRIKNAATLIHAFSLVKAALPGARLLLFGSGLDPAGPARLWARRHGIDGPGLDFRGPLDHPALLRALAGEADILVHPALTEANCMAMGEALSLGLRVVAGDVGGNAWTVAPFPARLIRNVRDPRALAEAMLAVGKNPPPEPGPGIWSAWEDRVAPDRIAAQLETLYLGGLPA